MKNKIFDSGKYKELSNSEHIPVLLDEVINALNLKENGHYLDCTFGRGGYSSAILSSANCFLTSVDRDHYVKEFADILSDSYGDRFNFINQNFSDIVSDARHHNKYDGIVMDLGVSSMQLDNQDRGFSFLYDGPLDMRMNNNDISGEYSNAASFVNEASEEMIADVIYEYGDEVQARDIAKAIVMHRKKQKIATTKQLADIITGAMHYTKNSKINPATKSFQAIRIFINREMDSLKIFLENVKSLLKENGKLVVVSFHSAEDKIVKDFIKSHEVKKIATSKYAKKQFEYSEDRFFINLTKKPIVPSDGEVKFNIRSRSAKMRVAQKISIDDFTVDKLKGVSGNA